MSKQSIIDRTRLELRDQAISFEASETGDGVTEIFNLPVEFVRAADLVVAIGGVTQTLTTHYSVEEAEGVVRFVSAPADGAEIFVRGYHYTAFTDAEIEEFVDTAFLQHTAGRDGGANGYSFEYTDLPGVEEYLVALLAKIEALWVLATEVAQGFDVHVPDGVIIPTGQTYEQLLNLIAATRQQYMETANALGVGLFRIQMQTLRRISRTTNRLVPLYDPMEYDQFNNGYFPERGLAGTVVTIRGKNFTGVTSVKFHGVEGDDVTVVNDGLIRATVPAGATTGPISITGPGGTLTLSTNFIVEAALPAISVGPTRRYPAIDRQGP